MAFSISYTYKIIDKYTPKLREIQKQTRAFNKTLGSLQAKTQAAGKDMQRLGQLSGKAARSINRASNKMNKPMGGFGKRLDKVNGKLNKFGRSAGGLAATVGGGLLFRKAMKDSFAYEQSIVNLTKVYDGLSGDKLKTFQTELGKVGTIIGQSKTGMNELSFAAGKLGIPLGEVAKFGELAGKVSVAFETDLGQATVVLGDMRTKLGLNNTELNGILDTINTLADNTTASGKDILEVTQRLSGLFKALKVPPDVGAGFAAVARQLSVSPQLAASGMKIFLQRLQDSKKFGRGVAESLAKDVPGTINKVLSKFRDMDRVTRNLAIQDLFGAEAAPFVMNLVESQGLLNKTLGLAANKLKTVGSMQREFERQQKTGNFMTQKMKASVENLSASLGTVFRPILKDTINFIEKAARKMEDFSRDYPGLTKIALGIGALVAIAAPAAIAIASTSAAVLWLSKVSWIASAGTWALSVGTWALNAAVVAFGAALTFVNTMLLPVLGIVATAAAPFALMATGATMISVGLAKMWESGSALLLPVRMLVDLFDRLTGFNVGQWMDNVAKKTSGLADSALGSVGEFLGFGDSEQSINVKKQMSNQTSVNGNIRVEAEQGTKVNQSSLKSSSPGNLGMNLAGAV